MSDIFTAPPIANNSLWHRIKRHFCAVPLLYVESGGGWVFGWKWRSGLIEITASGQGNPWEIIRVPSRTVVYHEDHP